MHILIILLFLLVSKLAFAGTMTATSGNMDYAMTRASVPDVLDGLVLHVPLRHSGMSYAQDVSQYQIQGTITGATWATGTARGLYFDGVNDSVNFGDPVNGSLDFGTGSFSYGCNFKKGNNATGGILYKGTSNFYQLYYHTTNSIVFYLNLQSGDKFLTATTTAGLDWHHYFITVNRTGTATATAKIFMDGVQTGTGTSVGTGSVSNSGNLFIGKYIGSSGQGSIDEVRIYNRALSNDEVNRIYTVTKH